MKCKRTDEFQIIKIRGRKYFTYKMSLNYENMYYNSIPIPMERAYVFSATTKDTGLEKYL